MQTTYLSRATGAILLLVLALALVFGNAEQVAANPAAIILDVRVTNVRDSAATVSWLTMTLENGFVRYGTSPGNLTVTVHDVPAPDDTHYVSLTGLLPSTTYYFEVESGGTTQGGSFTTGPTLSQPPNYLVYGQVFKVGGVDPAERTIVYINLQDDDGVGSTGASAPLSALVESNGYWNYSLGNARTAALTALFTFTPESDELELFAEGANDGRANQTVLIPNNNTSAPPMTLNGIPLAVTLASFTAAWQGEAVKVAWETVSELDTLGFHLWRGTEPHAPSERLNSELIPAQGGGGGQGAAYEWDDTDVSSSSTYYYWLEDVDVQGQVTRHGPVQVTGGAPTALHLTNIAGGAKQGDWVRALIGLTFAGLVGGAWRYRARPARK